MWRRARNGGEAPRPPGWKPAPQPPPGPAAPQIALAPPAPFYPAPKPVGATPAAAPVPARRAWRFPWLTLWFAGATLVRSAEVMGGRSHDMREAMLQGANLASLGAAVVLTLGLARGERWLPRAATIWAATVVARYALETIGIAGPDGVDSVPLFFSMSFVPIVTAMYIQHRARKLGLLS